MIADIQPNEAVIVADGSALRAAATAGLRGDRVIVPDIIIYEAKRLGAEGLDELVEQIGATVIVTEELEDLQLTRTLRPEARADGLITSAITTAARSFEDKPTVLLYDPAQIMDGRYYVSGSRSLRVAEI